MINSWSNGVFIPDGAGSPYGAPKDHILSRLCLPINIEQHNNVKFTIVLPVGGPLRPHLSRQALTANVVLPVWGPWKPHISRLSLPTSRDQYVCTYPKTLMLVFVTILTGRVTWSLSGDCSWLVLYINLKENENNS